MKEHNYTCYQELPRPPDQPKRGSTNSIQLGFKYSALGPDETYCVHDDQLNLELNIIRIRKR